MKGFWKDCQNCILYFQRNIVGDFFRKEPLYLWICSGFGWKIFRSLDKTKFYCSRGTLLEKFLFWKKYRFIDFLRASGDNFLAGLSKLISGFPEEFFARESLLEKFYHIMNVLRASVELFYGRIVKTAVHNFRRTFLVKLFVWKNYRFINLLRASGEKMSAGLSKLLSNLTEKHCKRNFFWKKPSFP